MKKKLSILFLSFFAINSFAQKISPYFPKPFVINTENKYETQITYFGLDFVSVKIQNYMSYKFDMTLNEEKTKYELKDGKGNITFAFIAKIAINTEPRELFFKYNVFTIENEFVIEELQITGNSDALLKFYVSYWSTNLNFDDVNKTEIVTNRVWQDRISYNFNNGSSYINVKNTTIESTEKFTTEFEIKKLEFDKKEKVRIDNIEEENKKKATIEKEKLKKEKNTKIVTFKYEVIKQRKSLKFEKIDKSFEDKNAEKIDLKEKFKEFLDGKEKGTYTVLVKYIEVYNNVNNIELEIKKFKKPKGVLNIVNDVIRYY